MKIEGSNIVFTKADVECMFTPEIVVKFQELCTKLDNTDTPYSKRHIVIPLDGRIWYGMPIITNVKALEEEVNG